ncbi:oligoribonuclease [Demequina capsici]|uniref:Oligoribonuclease n=1 Tax=Demequina capsici TaxID=3075620 RepID=A0AA96JB02_9MICO|nr:MULTISPECIES: oligoribonuclease [unclassified Demequina]WNM25261.1 oligoribonuclease [Demequina sp. OYTSA14]WNM28158.1 oligoribonuclease [Demequina sp. PMTSA13]
MASDHLVWIDCEMTGLDLENDALVEVACLVTDAELNVLGDGVSVVIRPPDAAMAQMNDFVTNMHATSGLLPELEHGTTMEDAQRQVLAYVDAHVPAGTRPPLAGNTVGMDKAFLERDMPQLMERLHYRVVDVSSLKELVRRWYPRVFFNAPEKTGGHRALGDIQDSIVELRYYRETVLAPLPGPDSDASRAAAQKVSTTGTPAHVQAESTAD